MAEIELDSNVAGATNEAASGAPDAAAAAVRPKAAAKVNLVNFAVYRTHGRKGEKDFRVEILAGAEASRVASDGRIELLAASTPFRSQALSKRTPKPGYGLLSLYGHRDAMAELQYWRAFALDNRAEFAYISFDVEVVSIIEQMVDRDRWREQADSKFLNIRRMRRDLQNEVLAAFQRYVKADGGNPAVEMHSVIQIATRPDLFDRLLLEDPDFKRAAVFVIPLADDPEGTGIIRQAAYVRPGSKVVGMLQGSDSAHLLLPSWVGDEKSAKKLRSA